MNTIQKISITTALLATVFLSSCGGGGGTAVEPTGLPANGPLVLSCADMGVGTETCVLDDPNNPYASTNVNNDTKWDLNDTSPSSLSRIYLWSTAQAQIPGGENQFYSAQNMQELFSTIGDLNAKAQAKKAYQYALDNYYDGLTYISQNAADFAADLDFNYGEWGSGSTLEGNYTGDSDYNPVWEVQAGSGWGASTAALAMSNFTRGFASSYTTLTFKLKGNPTSNIVVKFNDNNDTNDGGGDDTGTENTYDLATYATDITGTTDWKQVNIPISDFLDVNLYNEFGIHSGSGNGGTLLLTDIGFTGNNSGASVVGDTNGDGYAYIYTSTTKLVGMPIRDYIGTRIIEPATVGLSQLYTNYDNEASDTLNSWGYNYDVVTKTIAKQ